MDTIRLTKKEASALINILKYGRNAYFDTEGEVIVFTFDNDGIFQKSDTKEIAVILQGIINRIEIIEG